jgi:hypothetical protein
MIGQYLPNNNENNYIAILQIFFASKPALVLPRMWLSGAIDDRRPQGQVVCKLGFE